MATVDEKNQLNVETVSGGKLTWYYIEKPTIQEVDYLAKRFHFHPLDLDDVLSRVQRPKIDEYEDHLFIVMHFPVFNKENRVTTASEVDIFIGENYVVTVHCQGDLKPLAKFFKECQINEEIRNNYLNYSSGYLLYHILDRLVNYCFPIVNKLTDNIDKIEDLIFTRTVPETVREISLIRRDLISFRRVIHPQMSVVEALENEDYPFLKEDQEIYFGDIADHTNKIWDALEDCKEVVDGLAETSNWLTSHRIQEIMRVLTILTAILAPGTLIASIYGMNVPLFGGADGGSLLPLSIILFIILAIALIMYFLFRRRHWL
jgi:magnesium transporter